MDSFAWLDLKATFGYEINKAISLHLFYEPDEDKVTIEYQLCIFHEYHNPQLDHQDFFGVTLGPQSQDRTGASFHRAQHCKTQPSVAPIWCLQNPSRYGNWTWIGHHYVIHDCWWHPWGCFLAQGGDSYPNTRFYSLNRIQDKYINSAHDSKRVCEFLHRTTTRLTYNSVRQCGSRFKWKVK